MSFGWVDNHYFSLVKDLEVNQQNVKVREYSYTIFILLYTTLYA